MKTVTPDIPNLSFHPAMKSKLSFRLFVNYLRKKQQANPSAIQRNIYQQIITAFERRPELLEAFDEPALIYQYPEIIDLLNLALFPLASESQKQLYALSFPYNFQIFYYSPAFEEAFIDLDKGLLTLNTSTLDSGLVQDTKCQFAYKWILEKYYNIKIDLEEEMTHALVNHKTDLLKYYKVQIDSRFMEIYYDEEEPLPAIDDNSICSESMKFKDISSLKKRLPLDKFSFEGFGMITIKDITQEAALSEMKNIVLNMAHIPILESYSALEKTLQTQLGIKDLKVNIYPFMKVNESYISPQEYKQKSLLFAAHTSDLSNQAFVASGEEYARNPEVIFFPDLPHEGIGSDSLFYGLVEKNIQSYSMIPVQSQEGFLGVIELASEQRNGIQHEDLEKVSFALPMIEQALGYHIESFNQEIEKLIKQKFTSLQPAVEWKFNEVAWEFIRNKQNDKRKPISKVIFEQVYPLYGAIDIRNSSVERNNAILKDFLSQLDIIQQTLIQIKKHHDLPLLDELLFKNESFQQNISNGITPEEEIQLNYYFDEEIEPIFRHLLDISEPCQALLQTYFKVTDQHHGHVYEHRRAFEESLQQINTTVSTFLEQEKEKIQISYPNYFEKYKTDGVEYNIYIGQSIAPNKPFNQIYLRNLRLWQLLSMAQIVQNTRTLVDSLAVPLQTTQLILVHSNPIDISFRRDERRFDTEGAYNLRYEIMKKRIDKALIKSTQERLTQPNTIAIVYTNAKDAEEYKGYIAYLQSKGLLEQEVEQLELEEMQGVYGLKAIRVRVS